MSGYQDQELGDRLDEIEVREHGAEYWHLVLAAAEPELETLRAHAGGAGAAVAPAGTARRRLFAGRRRWLWIPSACAVAAAAALVMLFGLPGRDATHPQVISFAGPPPASAAEAIQYALGALDDAQGLQGTLYVGKVEGGAFLAGDKVSFLCARDGSFRVTTRTVGKNSLYPLPGYVETTAYDASTRVAQGVFDFGRQGFTSESTAPDPTTGQNVTTMTNSRYVFTEDRDVAPGPPDAQLYGAAAFPLWQVRAYLRTMLAGPHVGFTTGRLDGRAVWRLRAQAFAAGSQRASRGRPVTIVIDAGTRLPLRVSGFRDGYEVRVDSAALTQAPAPSEFTLKKPPAAETQDQSQTDFLDQFQRFPDLPLSDAAGMEKTVDGVPAFPAWLPSGFELQAGVFQTNGIVSVPHALGVPGDSIPNTIVSLAYRRGFDAAYVSVRPDPRLNHESRIGLPGQKTAHIRVDTSDPFVGDVAPWDRAQWVLHTTHVVLRAGGFEGATAHIIVDPGYWPHLWVKRGGWVATVAGDLTRRQMVRVAESLGAWEGRAEQ